MPYQEKRKNFRQALDKPVKVFCPDTGKYLSGKTINLSTSGALIELNTPSLLVPGQQLQLGISWSSSQTILSGNSLTEATVVRSLGHNANQQVAMQFNFRQEAAMAA